MPGARPILLDCDPGHDDAVAILLAAGRPDAVDLRAVTTVAGNAELAKVTLNARRVLTLAGATGVPVAAGAAVRRR
jgi:inosine/uridine nucleosidase